MKKSSPKGFTLLEVLAVMALFTSFLILGTSLFKNMGLSGSRNASHSLLLGGLKYAQMKSLSSNNPVALVMMPYREGGEKHSGRSFTICEAIKDDITGQFTMSKQLRPWTAFPGGFFFSESKTLSPYSQNPFSARRVITMKLKGPLAREVSSNLMPAIVFNHAGRVTWPSGQTELEIHLTEGRIHQGQFITTENQSRKTKSVFAIGRQTGRARLLRTK